MDPALRKAIYDKYIAPTQKQRPDYIGVEIEMPVVNLANEPVDERVALAAAEQFAAHFGFQITGRGADGNFTSAQDSATGDILSFDCCYSNLELSFGKARGLGEESLLAPLYDRARRHSNPANDMLSGIENGVPLRHYIEQYAAI